jgi:uncharacterized protein (DUF302 family)
VERSIAVRHISLEIKADFDRFTRALEHALGRFDEVLLAELDTDPQSVAERLKEAAGEDGLMLFNVYDHGKLLSIYGTSRKARQYVLGNPLFAAMMTHNDIRTGLYAPLRLLVYEAHIGSTRLEFDQPSSLFGQFDNPEATAAARALDTKLASLIKKAELLALE